MAVDGYFKERNQWGVILGGSSGIGLACARKLASEGLNLWILHRDRKSSFESFRIEVESMRGYGVEVIHSNIDATTPDKIDKEVELIREKLAGKALIKVLIHSISRGNLKSMPELTQADFSQTINAMALSLNSWFQGFYNNGLFTSDALVLGMTSEGSVRSLEGYAAVSSAKASLEAIARSIAVEYARFGIRCNLLRPGVCDTPSLRMIPDHERILKISVDRNPSGRLTLPEDVANVAYLLCRDEAAWINGTIIPVDGGEIIH